MKIPQSLIRKLNERKEADSFRSLSVNSGGVDFYSNDYLGVAQLKHVSKAAEGATGSRLISGHTQELAELENYAATFFKAPDALLFNSGYVANLGLLASLPQRGDTILYDELCHASIRDGIQLSNADAFKFRHNDTSHLKSHLRKAKGEVYVVVESVYSMDGDEADLDFISMACEESGAFLIVDEAHSGGIYGTKGEGICAGNHCLFEVNVFARVMTFGKAFGSHGAMVLGSPELKDYLINFSRPLIYTTALPPASIERIQFALETVKNAEEERLKLKENILFFRLKAAEMGVQILESTSPIQGIVIPGNTKVKEKASMLNEKGFLVKAILSPTVPKGKERIRICLHSYNTREEIEQLISLLK